MNLLQAPREERWAKVSFHKNLAADRPGGPTHWMPSGCCGSHLRAADANLAFYSEILGTTGLREEPGKAQEEYIACASPCPTGRAQWDDDLTSWQSITLSRVIAQLE